MIKYNNAFNSENGVEVVLKLKKYKKSYYDVEFEWDSNMSPSYFGSIMKKGSKWEIFTMLDNYWTDYSDISFKTLKEAIEYIGITEIEKGQYFNLY